MTSFLPRSDRLRPERRTMLLGGAILYVEGMIVSGYVLFANVTITDPFVLLFPWIWINASLLAVAWTNTAPSSIRRRRLALLVGVVYFVVLAVAGGLVAPGHAFHGHAHVFGINVAWPLPPGWGPTVFYGGEWVGLALIPYKVVGYAALSYLVYATVLDAAGSALAGVVGLFSCVSCAWPIAGTVLTSALGSTSAVAAFATDQPYTASTIVFLSAIALLYYRPLVGD